MTETGLGIESVHRLGGMRVFVQSPWPKVERGTRIVRFPAHPLILWLAGAARSAGLRVPSWVTCQEANFPNIIERDPVVDVARSCIHCSPAQFEVLKRGMQPSL